MLKLKNTLTKKKEALKKKKLRLFVCGPTVYDYAHIGHARTYLFFDALVKYLRQQGHQVDYLQNITDIDDKIIQRAKREKTAPKALARRFEKEYRKDMKALGIHSVSSYARATDHIKEIISQVRRLLKKGYAYEIPGDGLYYDIAKFRDYGKLSGRTSLKAEDAVSRIDDSAKKKNKGDFALWKFSKKGEPSWKSPWGKGRPGWHIEDTAITEKRFGPQYELHGGARDLIFPHHEAEIAQMEALSGKKPMAKHWLHTGFLTVQGQKMAKSLGNFITIQDFLKEHSLRLLRLLVLKTHYVSPIDYSPTQLSQAQRELERIDEFRDRLKAYKGNGKTSRIASKTKKDFLKALEDDFNAPKALSALFSLITKANAAMAKNALSVKDAKALVVFLKEIDALLGIMRAEEKTQVPKNILTLLRKREELRKKEQWQKADDMRKQLLKKGWLLNDTPRGPRVKRK